MHPKIFEVIKKRISYLECDKFLCCNHKMNAMFVIFWPGIASHPDSEVGRGLLIPPSLAYSRNGVKFASNFIIMIKNSEMISSTIMTKRAIHISIYN